MTGHPEPCSPQAGPMNPLHFPALTFVGLHIRRCRETKASRHANDRQLQRDMWTTNIATRAKACRSRSKYN